MFADSRATLFDKHSRPLWMGILFSPLPSLFPLWPRVARQRAVVTMHEGLVTGRGSCFETALSTSFPNLVPILKRIPRKYETAPLMPLATTHGSWHGNLIPKERRFKRTCRNNYTNYRNLYTERNQLMCRSKINCDIDVLIWGHNGGNIPRFANNGQRPVIS